VQRAYPLYPFMTRLGVLLGVAASLLFSDLLAGILVLILFLVAGHSWRHDMLPALPAVLCYQLFALSIGYLFYVSYGYYPGGGSVASIEIAVIFSAAAVICLLIGFRLGLRVFRHSFRFSLTTQADLYVPIRLFWLTAALFSVNFVFDIVPTTIWFGAAQMISNILMLRYVPYFMLLVVTFEQRKGLGLALAATVIVILPELLTGFSRFKEILLFVVIAALIQWRPWIRSAAQKAINRGVMIVGTTFSILTLGVGLVWTGGLKVAWRDAIWGSNDLEASPIERMQLFFELAVQTVQKIDIAQTLETLATRFSSGTQFFAYTIERVPTMVAYQDGRLLGLALENLMPRVLFPEKRVLGGDSWIVREFAGLTVAGDESGASVGLGWPAEFYIDFGPGGVIALSIIYGFVVAACLALLARVARNREIFFGLMIAILTSSLMSIDGSFIKLLPGLIQRTLIAAAAVALMGPLVLTFAQRRSKRRPPKRQSSWSAPIEK
jgi:hypothetical protein